MENRSHALIAGIFTVLLTIAIVATAMWLNRDTTERVSYTLVTNGSVAGLNPQAAVRYRGMEVGKVEAIEFDTQKVGQILVQVGIQPNTPVTTATFAELGMQGLTGLAFIQLDADANAKDPKPLPPSARLVIRPSLLDRVSASGEGLVAKLSTAADEFNQLLSENNQRLLTGTLTNLQAVSAKVGVLVDEVQPAARNVSALAAAGRQTLLSANDTMTSITKLAQDLDHRVDAVDRIAVSADQVGRAADAFENGTLTKTNTFMDDAGRSARTIDRAVDRLGDDPGAILFGPQPGVPGPGETGFVAPKAPIR
ncbi:MAG TPA: MlaD family protein [Burkholderiales bacterium]|jgi:phospholipid/cholesterol/gamma-HCH transport system substrate-binding protein|nr:MlaD family protein [Burkholderiales bacterium]